MAPTRSPKSRWSARTISSPTAAGRVGRRDRAFPLASACQRSSFQASRSAARTTAKRLCPLRKERMDDPQIYLSLAQDVVQLAKRCGADDADVLVAAGTEFEVNVRKGEI